MYPFLQVLQIVAIPIYFFLYWLCVKVKACEWNDCNLYPIFIFQVMTVGGSSHQIDVFTNFSYRAFSLSF